MKDPRCKKLIGGLVVHITPSKVPRLIGKKGSMVNTIKTHTRSMILVGQNGRVWVKGGNETLAAEAIYMVDRYSHHAGLTEMVEKFLKENVGDADERKEN